MESEKTASLRSRFDRQCAMQTPGPVGPGWHGKRFILVSLQIETNKRQRGDHPALQYIDPGRITRRTDAPQDAVRLGLKRKRREHRPLIGRWVVALGPLVLPAVPPSEYIKAPIRRERGGMPRRSSVISRRRVHSPVRRFVRYRLWTQPDPLCAYPHEYSTVLLGSIAETRNNGSRVFTSTVEAVYLSECPGSLCIHQTASD